MNFSLLRLCLIFALATFWAVPCPTGISAAENEKLVPAGTWGGEHIILQVSKSGAEAEFDCARGQISQPITLDKQGNFDVPGTFTAEHGGPVRDDENNPPAPARYSGHLEGDTMTLTVTRKDDNLGTFTLTRGSHPTLTKCR